MAGFKYNLEENARKLKEAVRAAVGEVYKQGHPEVIGPALNMAMEYVGFLDKIQRLSKRERLLYWELSTALYTFLHDCRQLRDLAPPFNPRVLDEISEIVDGVKETYKVK
jgi:hypothetical protein